MTTLVSWEKYLTGGSIPPRHKQIAKSLLRLLKHIYHEFPGIDVSVRSRGYQTLYIDVSGVSTDALTHWINRPASRQREALNALRNDMMPRRSIGVSIFVKGDKV